ncbi:threonyl-tRNA synthetase, partial [Ramicandelaber brevisporus]
MICTLSKTAAWSARSTASVSRIVIGRAPQWHSQYRWLSTDNIAKRRELWSELRAKYGKPSKATSANSAPSAASTASTASAASATSRSTASSVDLATRWHSSAHVLGAALEKLYGDNVFLCDGPPLLPNNGFFYEFLLLNEAHPQSSDYRDLPAITSAMREIASAKPTFERLEISLDDARRLFASNPFKLQYIKRIAAQQLKSGEDGTLSVYRLADFIDLCRGPHLPTTASIKSLDAYQVAAAHWVQPIPATTASTAAAVEASSPSLPGSGDSGAVDLDSAQALNRVYGVSFASESELANWHKQRETARQNGDHRNIGAALKLFMIHESSPGSPFILPHGTRVIRRMTDMITGKLRQYGFDEVVSPIMYKKSLWETSGHWDHYRENMFVQAADDSLGLKPMNCPGHCLIFAHMPKSFRELPVRYADFSPLHRNEESGALTGLTRVIKFHQDDGHIFCRPDQVRAEIQACLELINTVYKHLGFSKLQYTLATRPEQDYIGTVELWNQAEDSLRQALNATTASLDSGSDSEASTWTYKHGDGAFYGPKIDVMVEDSQGRRHQTATIQLDYQLPQRFGLKYTGSDGKEHPPVMIHRAVFGSLERCFAVLLEHHQGKLPFWLSPRQAVVCPVNSSIDKHVDYAHEVLQTLTQSASNSGGGGGGHYYIDVDASNASLGKRIRSAQSLRYNFMIVVGDAEAANRTVQVRANDGTQLPPMSLDELRTYFADLSSNFK